MRTGLGVEYAFGANFGGDPGRIDAVFRRFAPDRTVVMQREAQFVQAQFVGITLPADINEAEHAAIEPAVVLRHFHRELALRWIETR